MGVGQQPARDEGQLANALIGSGLITDPWVDGQSRFSTVPLRLPAAAAQAIAGAAERVAAAYHEAALLAQAEPEVLDDVFALTPVQKLLWHSSAPLWHGIARADVFLVDEPMGSRAVVCELNADTPSGQPEAVLLGPATGVPPERDPNRKLGDRFGDLLERFLQTVQRPDASAPGRRGHRLPDRGGGRLRADSPVPALVSGAGLEGGAGVAVQPAGGAGRTGGPVRDPL